VAARGYDRKFFQMVTRNVVNVVVADVSAQTRLDKGDGKQLTLNECSREQLEEEVSSS
jgi:hypothetical protein